MAANMHLNNILKIQKRAIRIIKSTSYLAHTELIFKELNVLTIQKVYIYKVGIFMFKFINTKLPDLFGCMFARHNEHHNYFTRHNINFKIPSIRLALEKKTIKYTGAKIWNYISTNIARLGCIITFKKKLKSFLLVTNVDNLFLATGM